MSEAATPTARRRSGLLVWAVRLALSATILWVIFHIVPFHEVWRVARGFPPHIWILGLIVFLTGHAVAAAKWRMLIGPGVSYPRALRAHLAGLAANLCLPSVAGGDVVRAGMVYREASDRARLAMGSVADRLLDTLGLVILGAGGAVIAFGHSHAGGPLPQILAAAAFAGVLGVLAAVVLAPHLERFAPRGEGKIARLIAKVLSAMTGLAAQPGRLWTALIASMAVQSAFIGVNVAFSKAAGLDLSTASWFFAWTAAKIIAIAPVTLGGLGLREASTAALLAPFGADAATVIAVGLIWQTLLYFSGLLGLVIQLPARAARNAQAAAQESPS